MVLYEKDTHMKTIGIVILMALSLFTSCRRSTIKNETIRFNGGQSYQIRLPPAHHQAIPFENPNIHLTIISQRLRGSLKCTEGIVRVQLLDEPNLRYFETQRPHASISTFEKIASAELDIAIEKKAYHLVIQNLSASESAQCQLSDPRIAYDHLYIDRGL
jgi:hypothetical protein